MEVLFGNAKLESSMGEIKVSIVMTYYERPVQLLNTLRSFAFHGYGSDIEVVIIDDGSIEQPAATITESFDFRIKHIYLNPADKWYSNPCIPFNIGFSSATGPVIIIQNAECFHYDNIVEHAISSISISNYLTYACLSQTKDAHKASLELTSFKELRDSVVFRDGAAVGDGVPGWYNHSKHNPRNLHFCAAIHIDNLKRLGGFDERYAKGICHDDDEFLYRISAAGLNPTIIDDRLVVHQWHYNKPNTDPRSGDKYTRNKLLFNMITVAKKPLWVFYVRYGLTIARHRIKACIRSLPGVLPLFRYLKKKMNDLR